MLRVISSQIKSGQSWLEDMADVDWFDDEEDQSEPGAINEDNYEDHLVDNIEEPLQEVPLTRDEILQEPSSTFLDEIPTTNDTLGIPADTKEIIYANSAQLVDDGIDNAEIIGFDYTNRHGIYSGFRRVEPHYTFVAQTTGNEILVSFDLDVNDIRAFIVGNVHPNGVRYQKTRFEPRDEIMIGI